MKIEQSMRSHVEANFLQLNSVAASKSFPAAGSLSVALTKKLPSKANSSSSVKIESDISKMFATASVDMWMRAVHTFLVSLSLTNVSDIWASVAGYYSSHYSIRAFAHLLGFFQLHSAKMTVRLSLASGHQVCEYNRKSASDREHVGYWKFVKQDPLFLSDPLFTDNCRDGAGPVDVSHRDRANYVDHLVKFPGFIPLDEKALRDRVHRISEIEFSTPPIPDADRYPDIESVQVVAYHRLVRYRDLVDSILGGQNRFWKVHRSPSWASYLDFQLTEQASLRSRFT